MDDSNLFTILQLCDSAFPTGGFSHSMGTEAAIQHLFISDFESLKIFILSCLENSGSSCIPFVKSACENANNLQQLMHLDSLHNATLLNHVSHRASKQQGKSFLVTSSEVFRLPQIEQFRELADNGKIHCHLYKVNPRIWWLQNPHFLLKQAWDIPKPVVFGVVCCALKIPTRKAVEMYLFNCLRTILASVVRLGKIGAIQAQHLQFGLQNTLGNILTRSWEIDPEESYITYPLTEVLQNSHDIMFSKMFFS